MQKQVWKEVKRAGRVIIMLIVTVRYVALALSARSFKSNAGAFLNYRKEAKMSMFLDTAKIQVKARGGDGMSPWLCS